MIHSRAILATCCAALLTVSFTTAGPAMCMPAMAKELHLDYRQQGLIFSSGLWSVPLSLLVAAAADRVGFRALMVLASAIQVAGWFLLAAAQGYLQALGGAFLVGLGGSAAEPLLTPLVCAIYPDRRAKMANFLHAFYCVGLVGVALLVMALAPAGLGWRDTFRLLGLLCVPHGLAGVLLAMPAQAHDGEVRQRVRSLLPRPLFWLLAACILLGAATEMGPADWLPSAIQSVAGNSDAVTAAGVGFALFGSLMALGRFLTAGLGARIGTRKLLTASASLAAVCLIGVALPVPPLPRIACLCLVGLGVASFWPTLMAAAGDHFPQAGASMFSVLSVTGSTGCAIVPVVVGFLAGPLGGIAPALGLLSVLPLVLLALTLRLPPPADGGSGNT